MHTLVLQRTHGANKNMIVNKNTTCFNLNIINTLFIQYETHCSFILTCSIFAGCIYNFSEQCSIIIFKKLHLWNKTDTFI